MGPMTGPTPTGFRRRTALAPTEAVENLEWSTPFGVDLCEGLQRNQDPLGSQDTQPIPGLFPLEHLQLALANALG